MKKTVLSKFGFCRNSILFLGFLCSAPTFSQDKQPMNVIMMIGDGMGVAQVTSAFYFGTSEPNFTKFPIIGLSETSATDNRITDSAAGATALSTGQKTYKRAIGVSSSGKSIPTILEQLKQQNYLTGLVCLTSVTHATPAAYYAHVKDRDMHEEIATQLVDAGVNFVAGGGIKYFNKRKDGKNLLESFKEKKYNVNTTSISNPDPKRNNLFVLAEEGLPNKDEGRGDFLPQATQTALNYFESRQKPFFLMIEGSYIDWGGHSKSQTMVVKEVLDFDKTIGVVLNFVKNNPNTLLIVTADHETGGVSLGKFMETDANTGKTSEIPEKVNVNFNTDQHTAALVPVFAMGPGQELFSGVYTNNSIYHKIVQALEKSRIYLK